MGIPRTAASGGNDPHFGWELGYFFVTGQTRVEKDADGNWLILKSSDNADDSVGNDGNVTLWFHLSEEIDRLNSDENLAISEDTNGYDERLSVGKTNFGRGALIVKQVDSNNMTKDVGPHIDFLAAEASPNADTSVQVCEEGDYEVALDYEIEKSNKIDLPGPFPTIDTNINTPWNNRCTIYRISFKFSVRKMVRLRTSWKDRVWLSRWDSQRRRRTSRRLRTRSTGQGAP